MLLLIAGPSTSGKDFVWLRAAEDLGFVREVPLTTRARRTSEKEGHDYEFVDVAVFQRLVVGNLLTEWDYVLGNYYGTRIRLCERVARGELVVLQVLARMGLRLRSRFGREKVRLLMLSPSSGDALRRRLMDRGYRGDELAQRTAHWAEEASHSPMCDVVVPDGYVASVDDAQRVLAEELADELSKSGIGFQIK